MFRARNTHTAPIDSIARGDVGEVDPTHGILLLVKAGHLELQDGTTVEELEAAVRRRSQSERTSAAPAPTAEDMNRVVDEIHRRGAVIDGLRDELAAARERIAKLESLVPAKARAAAGLTDEPTKPAAES